MPERKKFKPVITRVKLNPEQAVLACCSQVAKGAVRANNRTQCATGTCRTTASAIGS